MRVEEFAKMGKKECVNIGDKCTLHYYSDSCPAQVVSVSKTGKTAYIRTNKVESVGKEMGHQEWAFKEGVFETSHTDEQGNLQLAESPDNHTFFKITKRKDGCWRTSKSNIYVCFGQWKYYYDWGF